MDLWSHGLLTLGCRFGLALVIPRFHWDPSSSHCVRTRGGEEINLMIRAVFLGLGTKELSSTSELREKIKKERRKFWFLVWILCGLRENYIPFFLQRSPFLCMEIGSNCRSLWGCSDRNWEKNKAGGKLVSGCLFLLRGGSGDWGMGLLSAWQRLMPR